MNRFIFAFCIFIAATASTFGAAKNFRIVASTNSPWREQREYDWVLQVNNLAKANLTLGHGVVEIDFTADQRKRVIDSALANGFFDMPEQIGTAELDIPTRSVSITNGDKKHSVLFYDPGPLSELSDEDLQKFEKLPAFLNLWAVIRSTFGYPQAADERKADEKLIRALEKRLEK